MIGKFSKWFFLLLIVGVGIFAAVVAMQPADYFGSNGRRR